SGSAWIALRLRVLRAREWHTRTGLRLRQAGPFISTMPFPRRDGTRIEQRGHSGAMGPWKDWPRGWVALRCAPMCARTASSALQRDGGEGPGGPAAPDGLALRNAAGWRGTLRL